jgi:hypothetical protein
MENGMQRKDVRPQSFVFQVCCDRCGAEAQYNVDDGFNNFLSIGFDASWGSALGDGNHVEIDLCHACLKELLRPWLRVSQQGWAAQIDQATNGSALADAAHGAAERASAVVDGALTAIAGSEERIALMEESGSAGMHAVGVPPVIPVGTIKCFGPFGPKYEVGQVLHQLDDGDWMVSVSMVETGEKAEYRWTRLSGDPDAR